MLPNADQIDLRVPSVGNFIALTAPVHADAPCLFKWGNGVAWYVYVDPSMRRAASWNLIGETWAAVTSVTPLPTMWDEARPMPFISDGVVLTLAGCVDTGATAYGVFPECLRDDLHEVRATIEAYAKTARLSGRAQASACGYDFRKGAPINTTLRVTRAGIRDEFHIDRWD